MRPRGFFPTWPASSDKADGLVNLASSIVTWQSVQPDSHDRSLETCSASSLQEAATMADSSATNASSLMRTDTSGISMNGTSAGRGAATDAAAVFAAQAGRAPESLYRWQWQSGRLLTRLGKLDEALSAYQEAAATLRPIRAEVSFCVTNVVWSSGPAVDPPLYFRIGRLLLQRAALVKDDDGVGTLSEDGARHD